MSISAAAEAKPLALASALRVPGFRIPYAWKFFTKSVQDWSAKMLTLDVSCIQMSVVQLRCHSCLLCPGAAVLGCAGASWCRWNGARQQAAAPVSLPWDGGIASTGSLWLCKQNSLSEPCRASPEECFRRWCSTKLWNKEQATSMMVLPFTFPSLLNVTQLPAGGTGEKGKEKMTQNSVTFTIYPKMCGTRWSSEVIHWRMNSFIFEGELKFLILIFEFLKLICGLWVCAGGRQERSSDNRARWA